MAWGASLDGLVDVEVAQNQTQCPSPMLVGRRLLMDREPSRLVRSHLVDRGRAPLRARRLAQCCVAFL